MSYIVKNKEDKFLVSFSKVTDDKFMILATNLKQFYVQKEISSEYIQERFNVSSYCALSITVMPYNNYYFTIYTGINYEDNAEVTKNRKNHARTGTCE